MTTDPDARLYRKGPGKEAKLAYLGHVLLDNRHGLISNVVVTPATGTAERDAAGLLLEATARGGSTVGADKAYDVASFVAEVRQLDVTLHVAQKMSSAIDQRTARHPGYAVSRQKRKLVEQVFGWWETVRDRSAVDPLAGFFSKLLTDVDRSQLSDPDVLQSLIPGAL